MIYLEKSIFVPYTETEMFTLVNEVDHYSEFIPGCQRSLIEQRGENELVATLCFAKMGIKQCFTTRNENSLPNKRIDMFLVRGPFKYLKGVWSFDKNQTETATIVKLEIEFEFSNKLISAAFGPVFNQITSSMVEAFSKRAESIYGQRDNVR